MSTTTRRRRPTPTLWPILGVAVLAAIGAMVLAPYGLTGIYVLLGVVALVVAVVVLGPDLVPPVVTAFRRIDPARFRVDATPLSPGREAALVGAVTCAMAGLAFVLAKRGILALAAVVAVVAVLVIGWLCWPLLSDLVRRPPTDLPARPRRRILLTAPSAAATRTTPVTPTRRTLRLVATAACAAGVAWGAAHLGIRGFVAVLGALVVGSLLAVVRDRSVFFTFATVCSLTLVLHKSLTTQDLLMSGGAISVYVTTFDVLVLLLYVLWAAEGTLVADLRAGFRRRIMWLPLGAALLLLPSLLVAPSVGHAVAELARMAWMYLLFVYVAIRVRTRRHVWAVLGGLVVFACLEFIVVVLQWRTGGVLGLSFLGVPTELGDRVTDTTSIGRPFGTIIHPVFMGAALGSVGLVALAFAIELPRSLTRIVAAALVPVSLLPLYIAQTRASLVAVGLAAVVIVGRGLVRGRLPWSAFRKALLLLLVVGVLALPSLIDKFSANFGTGHFYEEVSSRLELNDIALRMIDDHTLLGIGLNNFELVMPRYEANPVIFANNPVHNLYLLYLAETGIVGFIGVLILGIALYDLAIGLARSRDRLFAAVGVGVAAAMGFLMVEELLGFSLRQDIPLALYWLLAGLAVACTRLDRAARRKVRSPGRDTAEALESRRTVSAGMPAAAGPNGRKPGWAQASSRAERRAGRRLRSRRRLLAVALATAVVVPLMAGTGMAAADRASAARRPVPSPTWVMPSAPVTPSPRPTPRESATPTPSVTPSAPATQPPKPTAGPSAAPLPPRPSAPAVPPTPGPMSSPTMTVGGSSATATATATASAPASPLATPSTPTAVAPPGAPPQSGALVFSAFDRTTAVQGIYRADPDGTHIRRITPADGRVYNWPRWAFGGTKIVYTVRAGEAGSPEAIAMMDPDGGNPTVLRAFDYRVGQPTVDGTGRWLYFTATAPWFQHVAVYRMDLHTLLSRNITAVTQPKGGFDADPFVTRDGSVLVATSSATGTSIERLAADGATRAKVTSGTWHDTDPDESPDGSLVALASYRGPGTPQAPTGGGFVGGEFAGVRTSPWRIVVTSRDGRSERVLTAGADCVLRGPEKACTIPQMSGFAPRFSPDGTRVGFVGALDRARTCICTLGVTGAQPRALLESLTLSIDWFDWLRRTGDPAAASRIGAARSTDRLLVTMRDNSGTSQLFETSADLMDRTVVQLPARLKPLQAHWGPDGRSIVFTANVPVPARDGAPHPAPPPGQQRRDHVTLADIDALSVALRSLQPEALERSRAQEQVFLRAPDGSVGQLTDPWIEDWRDGVALGDARANTDPILSADGHTLVVTNISTTTGESFLLRINLATGAVLNLTNATAGALPATDGEAALSPDGAWIAFSWVEGGARQVYLMSARDGSGVRALTRASGSARMPSWLPDGSAVVQVHEVAGRLALELVSVTGDGRTGATRVLTGVLPGPGWRPVPSPDGSRILVLGTTTAGRIGPFLVPVRGGAPSLIQADPMHDVLSVDWRRP